MFGSPANRNRLHKGTACNSPFIVSTLYCTLVHLVRVQTYQAHAMLSLPGPVAQLADSYVTLRCL